MANNKRLIYRSYTEHGDRYMICQNSTPTNRWFTGRLCGAWSKVGVDTVAVLCPKCVARVSEPPISVIKYTPSGRPKGWQWMSEFVHADGTVYFKGEEQPELKGTLPITVIKQRTGASRLSKREKESRRRTAMAELYDLKKALKRATLKKEIKMLELQITQHKNAKKLK
jgi:hypothetical protein